MHDASATVAPAPQHMTALRRANEVRLARAEVKRQVKAGTLSAAEVLADIPECAETMMIGELLSTQHRWAGTRTRKFLAALGMPETKTLGAMTIRQRAGLAGELDPGSDAHRQLARLERTDRRRRGALCHALNGSGPCLRGEGHEGACVRGVYAYALGMVFFRNAKTDALIRSVEVPLYGPEPSTPELVAMFARVEAGLSGHARTVAAA